MTTVANKIDRIVDRLVKRFGRDGIIVPQLGGVDGSLSKVKYWVPLPLKTMQAVLGVRNRGVAGGKVIEIFGPESSGKSSLAAVVMAAFQAQGGLALYADTEFAFDETWARRLGLRDAFVRMELKSKELKSGRVVMEGMEDLFLRFEILMREARAEDADIPIILGWDSLAATPTRAEINGAYQEATDVSTFQARCLARGFSKIKGLLARYGVTLLIINQTRDTINQWGKKATTPGGKAYKFYCDVRAEITRVRGLKQDDRKIGVTCKIVNVKNKLGAPFAEAEYMITAKRGLEELG